MITGAVRDFESTAKGLPPLEIVTQESKDNENLGNKQLCVEPFHKAQVAVLLGHTSSRIISENRECFHL